jgi:hypothetical protein
MKQLSTLISEVSEFLSVASLAKKVEELEG